MAGAQVMSVETDHGSQRAAAVRAIGERVVHACEVVVIAAAELLVVISIVVATVVLYTLFFSKVGTSQLGSIDSVDDLQDAVERLFAGVLLLLLGLELLRSLTSFFVGYRFQLEIIVVVAMIAVARHIMLIDFKHIEAPVLLGAAALMLALAISYAIVRQPDSKTAKAPEP
jgi:uncharacterized membrane protein (DUF373 family)